MVPPLWRIHGSVRESTGRTLVPVVLFALLGLHFPAPLEASDLALRLTPDRVKQGGVSILSIEWQVPIRALRVWAGGREIHAPAWTDQSHVAMLIGIDLEQAPGPVAVRQEATHAPGPGCALSRPASHRAPPLCGAGRGHPGAGPARKGRPGSRVGDRSPRTSLARVLSSPAGGGRTRLGVRRPAHHQWRAPIAPHRDRLPGIR